MQVSQRQTRMHTRTDMQTKMRTHTLTHTHTHTHKHTHTHLLARQCWHNLNEIELAIVKRDPFVSVQQHSPVSLKFYTGLDLQIALRLSIGRPCLDCHPSAPVPLLLAISITHAHMHNVRQNITGLLIASTLRLQRYRVWITFALYIVLHAQRQGRTGPGA